MAYKAKNQVTWGSIFGAAFLSIFLGGFLAAYTLMTRPVIVIAAPPKPEEIKEHAVYFQQGLQRGASAWRTSRDRLIAGTPSGNIVLNENDLNNWALTQMRNKEVLFPPITPTTTAKKDTKKPAEKPKEEPVDIDFAGLIGMDAKIGEPNFRFTGEALQLSVPVDLPVVRLIKGKPVVMVFQTTGDFVRTDNSFTYRARSASLGSLALPDFAVVPVTTLMAKLYHSTEEYKALAPAWDKLGSVSLQADALVLTIP